MNSLDKLKTLIKNGTDFLLICHEHPDGDSIGSLLAMGEILSELEKRVSMVSKDPVPEVFRFLKHSKNIKKDFLLGDYDTIILLDNGDFKRTGFSDRLMEFKKKGVPIINIDHHPKNDLWRIASLNYVNIEACSTCQIIYEIAEVFGIKPTSSMATAVLTGIFTDTGGFQHSNTSKRVLEIAGELLNFGAKLKAISGNIANSHSVAMLKLWGIALNRLMVNQGYGLVYSIITKYDIKEVGATADEVSGLVNLINSIPGTRFALLLYETADGKIKGSFRTESDDIDLSKIALMFGGGGHKKASGFSVDGELKKIKGFWQVV